MAIRSESGKVYGSVFSSSGNKDLFMEIYYFMQEGKPLEVKFFKVDYHPATHIIVPSGTDYIYLMSQR